MPAPMHCYYYDDDDSYYTDAATYTIVYLCTYIHIYIYITAIAMIAKSRTAHKGREKGVAQGRPHETAQARTSHAQESKFHLLGQRGFGEHPYVSWLIVKTFASLTHLAAIMKRACAQKWATPQWT